MNRDRDHTSRQERSRDIQPWPRGRCEHWMTERTMCGKKGRWMVDGQIRCGEHKSQP